MSPALLKPILTWCLLVICASAAEPATPVPPAVLREGILTAARAGDSRTIDALIEQSFKNYRSLDQGSVKEMLDGLVRGGELPAFVVLVDAMLQTTYGKDWQPDNVLLAGLAGAGRRDFLDALLARRLNLDQLSAVAKDANPAMAEWITRRVAEVRQSRADLDALVAAAAKGDIDTMRTLLDAGVPINGVSTDQWTPLTRAANKNQAAAVKLLLERGAAVDQARHPGWDYTALCLTKSVEVAELLKAAGTNVHAKLFRRDVSILTYICRWGGADMVEWMLKQGLDPKMIGDNRQNLLFDAGDARTAEMLLAAGVDPNAVDEFGKTPLVEAQSAQIALRLIEGGARIGSDESLVLRMVQAYASADAIALVIKAMGKLSPRTAQTALMAATHSDQAEVVRMLLQHGAQADKPGSWGFGGGPDMRPLMVCAVFGEAKTAKVLLENGADPNAGEQPGELLQTAIKNGHQEVAKLLRKAGAKGVTDLTFALATKDEAEIDKLLKSAPSFAEQPEFWTKALSTAARNGQLAAVRVALDKGAPPHPNAEEDAVADAAFEGQHEVLAEILSRRPSPNDPAELRQALWNAVWNSRPYPDQRKAEHFERCVKLLLDAGAPVAPVEGRDDMMVGAVFTRNPGGNPKVIEMLVAGGANPNPIVQGSGQRLSEVIETSCREGGFSGPLARAVETFEKLAKVTIKR